MTVVETRPASGPTEPPEPPPPVGRPAGRPKRKLPTPGRILLYSVLTFGAFLIVIPFLWTISTSLKTEAQTLSFPPTWIPDPFQWQNYPDALTARPFARYYWNSIVVAVLRTVGMTLSSAFVAYGFARMRFPGRNKIFVVVLLTLMLPDHVLIIPKFILFRELGWLDSLLPLIVPKLFGGGFAIFLLRQYYMTIPLELDEAAKIDGAGYFGTFWHIILPLSKPALGVVAVFEFLEAWRDFFSPLIYLSSNETYTVPLGLAAFRSEFFTEWHLFMAASAAAMAVPLLVFFVAQKYFISGVALLGGGGTKG